MEEKSNNQFINWFSRIKKIAKKIKKEIGALYLASKRSDVPFFAKVISILVVGYALSPIDLIPDFIPVIGYVDDLILVPLGIYIAIKLIPKYIMDECKMQAEDIFRKGKTKNWIAGAFIVLIWISLLVYILIKFI